MEILAIKMEDQEKIKYDRAKKRVEAIKGFYSHVRAYIVVNLIILLLRANVMNFVKGGGFDTIDFQDWLDWNSYLTPVLWGLGLALHGIYVFYGRSNFVKDWENRKIKEIMDKDDSEEEKIN